MNDAPNKIELGEGAMRSRLIGSHAGEPTLVGSRAAQPALAGSHADARTLVNTARDLRPVPIAAPALPVEDFTRWATRSIASAEMRVTALEQAFAEGHIRHAGFPELARLPFTPILFASVDSMVTVPVTAADVDIPWFTPYLDDPAFIERDGTDKYKIKLHRYGRYIVMVNISVYADLTGLTYAEDRMDTWQAWLVDSGGTLITGTGSRDQLIYLYSSYASDMPYASLCVMASIEMADDDYFSVKANKFTDNMVLKVNEAQIVVWRAIRS